MCGQARTGILLGSVSYRYPHDDLLMALLWPVNVPASSPFGYWGEQHNNHSSLHIPCQWILNSARNTYYTRIKRGQVLNYPPRFEILFLIYMYFKTIPILPVLEIIIRHLITYPMCEFWGYIWILPKAGGLFRSSFYPYVRLSKKLSLWLCEILTINYSFLAHIIIV